MQNVDDPSEAYRAHHSWLRKGGVFAHQIGFDSHATAWRWNGHYTYAPWMWRVIQGRAPYLINRWPLSWHLDSLRKAELVIDRVNVEKKKNDLSRSELATMFREITDDDLETYVSFISGKKNI